MVESSLDLVFKALGSPVRRAMLLDLGARERTVGELAGPHSISLAAASKHVQVLERAGMVERTVVGRNHVCRLAVQPLEEAYRWLDQHLRFWDARLDALEAALGRTESAPEGEEP